MYLIVVGLVLDVLRSLGARIDVEMAEARRPEGERLVTAYLSRSVIIGGLTSCGCTCFSRNLTRMLLGLCWSATPSTY